MSLSCADLTRYVGHQLDAWLPDASVRLDGLGPHVSAALERLEYCFDRVAVKRFQDANGSRFDHLHTDQYAAFLYFLSNTIHRQHGAPSLAARVYALNKALHAFDAFYEVELPDVFALQHPVGTVLGRARYSDYLFVYQRCSVGSNLDGAAPVLGEGVVMFGGSAVIGACTVGHNVWLSVGTTVLDADVPPDTAVFGHVPSLTFKPTGRNVIDHFFRHR